MRDQASRSDARTAPATFHRKLHGGSVMLNDTLTIGTDGIVRAVAPSPVRRNEDLPFATRIRERRLALNLTIIESASRMGISEGALRNYEIGEPCMKLPTVASIAYVLGFPVLDLVREALVSIDQYHHRQRPELHMVPSPVSLLEEAQALGLRAIRDYGHEERWIIWSPSHEGYCVETTVDSCSCERFHLEGSCPCIALVRELEASGKERAA